MGSEKRFAKLGECLSSIIDHRGKTPKKLGSDWVEQGIPTISAKNVNGGRLVAKDSIRRVTHDVYKRWMNNGDVQRGDCLLVSEGATLGECMYWDESHPIVLGQRLFCLRANPEVLYPRYLYFYMTSYNFQSEVIARSTGTSVPGLRQTEVMKLQVRLPSIAEQQIIGDTLYSLNKKIELNRRMNETLEATARAIFKSWFVDFDPVRAKMDGRKPTGIDEKTAALFPDEFEESELGKIPKGWKVVSFDTQIESRKGLSYKGSGLSEVGIPMHNLNSVYEGGGYKFEGIKFYAGEYDERHIVKPGDLIVTNTEQGHDCLLIGYAAVVPNYFGPSGIFTHHIYRVSPLKKSHLTTQYLRFLLNSRKTHDEISGYANGTTVNMLPADALQRPKIVLPPKKLIHKFDHFTTVVFAKNEGSLAENHTLTHLRDTLLPKLLSGELKISSAANIVKELT